MKRVLMIDDDSLVSGILKRRFEQSGFAFEVACDGETGLAAIKRNKPDIVLLDLELPKVRGNVVLASIRSQPDLQDLPVIIFSSGNAANVAEELKTLGVFRVLSKINTRPAELIAIVHSAMEYEAEASVRDADADSDASLQNEFKNICLAAAPKAIEEIYGILKQYFKNDDIGLLLFMSTKIHTLAGNTGLSGMHKISSLAGALETLIKQLCKQPEYSSFSTDRTISQAVDVLGLLLLENQARIEESKGTAPRILVVDDQEIARRAVCHALDKAKLDAVCADSPRTALELLEKHPFDLILLDIQMPEMDGLEVCSRLRNLPLHAKTPVIFVSHLSDISDRLDAYTQGGNDFIAKPFLSAELAVRAMGYALLSQAKSL